MSDQSFITLLYREYDISLTRRNLKEIKKFNGFSQDMEGNITHLNLKYLKLTSIPDDIGNLGHLIDLNLRNNQLTTLPKSISKLSKLENLNLDWNNLTELPQEIGKLINLKNLNIFANNLVSLPESISYLENLQKLRVSANKLISIPESIGNLIQLHELNLRSNKLAVLPDSIGFLRKLEIFNISDNILTKLPVSFANLRNLKEFYIVKNNLSFIPKPLGRLPKLKRLDLNQNRIEIKIDTLEYYSSRIRRLNIDSINISINTPIKLADNRNLPIALNLIVPDLDFVSWLENFPSVIKLLSKENEIIFYKETVNEHEFKTQLLKLQKYPDTNVQILSYKFSAFFIQEELKSGKITSKLVNMVDFLYPFIYILLGATFLIVLRNFLVIDGIEILIKTETIILILLLLFLSFQFYTGFTIEKYVLNITDKFSLFGYTIARRFKRLRGLIWISSSFRSSLGLFLGFFWIINFVSLTSKSETFVFFLQLDQLNIFNDFIVNFIPFFQNIIISFNYSTLFGDFSDIVSFLFKGWFGTFIRVSGVLMISWSVFNGGYRVLRHPHFAEDRRKLGVKLDFYEVLALPLGLVIGFVIVLLDASELSFLSVYLFQVGFFVGGFVYFLKTRELLPQLVLVAIFLLSLQILNNMLIAISINLLDVHFILSVITVLFLIVPPFYPSKLSYENLAGKKKETLFISNKWSLWRLLGRPKYQYYPISTRWRKFSKYFRLNPWRNGIVMKLDETEKKWDIIRSYDLTAILVFIEMNLIIPLLVIGLFVQQPTSVVIIFLLLAILLSIYDNNPLKELDIGWRNGRKAYTSKIYYDRGNLISLDLSNVGLKILPAKITQLAQLQILNISNNQISNLPESFTNLTSLQHLNISNTNLNIIPDLIFQLENLEELHISEDQQSFLPKDINENIEIVVE